jgi:predicted dehydrogenase
MNKVPWQAVVNAQRVALCLIAQLHKLLCVKLSCSIATYMSILVVFSVNGVGFTDRLRSLQVGVEYHKRFDPIYADARDRIRQLGPFSYYYSYMAQQKQQLDTFRAWAGKSSDINYYLNSHHIDIHNWCVSHMAYPVRVTASACTGEAVARLGRACEDTITLTTQWVNKEDGSKGTAVYTASWIAPKVRVSCCP